MPTALITDIITILHNFTKSFESSTSNLVEITQFIGEVLDRQSHVAIIYTEFSKVFDFINNSLLAIKRNISFSCGFFRLVLSHT